MRWTQKLSDNIKRGIRSWLQVQPAQPYAIQINEVLDFELSAIRNRIWYRGDGNELEQLYGQNPEWADKYKFWASKCTPGMEMRKIHTGLPGLMVRILTAIVLADMNDVEFDNDQKSEDIWKKIVEENKFPKKLERALKEVLVIGDGAFKVTIDTETSQYPILEWYPGERIEVVRKHDRVKEIIFKTDYPVDGRRYVLNEHYGKGYIKNELYLDEKLVDMAAVLGADAPKDYSFDANTMLAVPLQVFESAKFEGRGGSIFDGKLDSFDAFDEAWSQWMDALRAGRAKTYIPECLIPRNPETGEVLKPSYFDNRYIYCDSDMSEHAKNTINTEQPAIPHDSYQATYCTALDLCLQGIISPSTLGIDVKKLDNADAQREKEKATLYTRNAIVEALQESLPELVKVSVNAYHILAGQAVQDVKAEVTFGEYANPSFESMVETLSKARPGVATMSAEAQVDEMWGDSRGDEWKKEEVARLKAEQGIAEVEEPGVNMAAGSFQVNVKEGKAGGSNGNEPGVPNETKGVPGTSENGQ